MEVQRGRYTADIDGDFGLAAAGRHLPAGRKADTAAAHIGATTADEPAVEPY